MRCALLILASVAALDVALTRPVGAGESDFAYDAYAAVLERYVDDTGMVDYKALKENRGPLDRFAKALADLAPTRYKEWSEPEKIAFWTNAYNALTLKVIIDHYPIRAGFFKSLVYPRNSIRQISGVWKEITFEVMGKPRTLDAIEHQVLRARFGDPRIHVALVCAAMGCPPLRREPYVAARLDEQFADQARRFLSNPKQCRIDRAGGEVYLSKIFKWFGKDFVEDYKLESGFPGHSEVERSVLNYVAKHVSAEDATYLRTTEYELKYLDYDWSLNEQE